MGRITLAFALVLVTACKGSSDPADGGPSSVGTSTSMETRKPSRASPDARIVLERTECFGQCPVYQVAIHVDGSVDYLGNDYVRVRGQENSKIDVEKVRALFDRFDQAGFWGWNDEYRFPVTDNPSAKLTLYAHGRTKTVVDYPPCHGDDPAAAAFKPPKELCELERAVDELAQSRQWVSCVDDAGARKGCPSRFELSETTPAGADAGANAPPKGPAKLGCEKPFWLDPHGVRRIKPQCM